MKILLIFLILYTGSAISQIETTEILDYNNASGIIGDEGIFFSRNSLGVAGYEIPKGSGKNTIYSGSLWVGAEDVNGLFYVSGSKYGTNSLQSQLHSGPIADPIQYTSLDYQNQYSEAIWKVNQQEIDYHIQNYNQIGYSPPQSIMSWPGNGDVSLGVALQLAPYADVNEDGYYTPLEGDYPVIRGSEAVYVIMNDMSFNPDYNALGIEVHMMFYQYHDGTYFSNTTFLNVQVFNRSTINYYNYRQALYLDFDIGHYGDDYIGCDSANNVVFAYNGDVFDEDDGGALGYGLNPPCQGVVALSHVLNSFGYFTNSGAYPYTDYQASDTVMWYFMNAEWGDGTPWVYGGQGYIGSLGATNTPSNFLYNGNPYTNTGWSEINASNGNANPPGDRRGVMTISENELPSGSSICSDFAFVYDKSSTQLQNVQNVINISNSLRQLYEYQFEFPCNYTDFNLVEQQSLSDFIVFPNPAENEFTISFEIVPQDATVEISDMTGRIVFAQTIENSFIKMNLENEVGVYFVSVNSKKGILVKKLILK